MMRRRLKRRNRRREIKRLWRSQHRVMVMMRWKMMVMVRVMMRLMHSPVGRRRRRRNLLAGPSKWLMMSVRSRGSGVRRPRRKDGRQG